MKKINDATHSLSIPLLFTESQHLICSLYINKKKGTFLIDTGASNSCIEESKAAYFALIPEGDSLPITAASETQLAAKASQKSLLGTKEQTIMRLSFMLITLETVNDALQKQDCSPIDGIIGADVLHAKHAVIDYGLSLLKLKENSKFIRVPMPF